MIIVNQEGKPVETGAILHGKQRYIYLGHDGKKINVQSTDGRKVFMWVDPARFNLKFQQEAS